MSEQKPPTPNHHEQKPTNLKASYKGSSGHWKGVIKLDGKIIWTCSHDHPNRDETTSRSRTAAGPCARQELARRKSGQTDAEPNPEEQAFQIGHNMSDIIEESYE